MKKKAKSKTRLKRTPPAQLYYEAHINNVPRALETTLSVWLFDRGCQGTHEKLEFTQPNLKYVVEIKPRRFIDMTAYFDIIQKENVEGPLSQWVESRAPEAQVIWQRQEVQDWLKEWKKYFSTFKIAGLNIVPSWKLKKGQGLKDKIVIEPGMAFGTGTHPTTRFALEMINKINETAGLAGRTVLDVGSGSGILAVAAERFGAKKIVAIDNDPESWRECRKTFKLNKTKKCSVTEAQLSKATVGHDVVIANIIDGVLIDLRKLLWRVVKPGGYLVLSGILADGASAFRNDFLENTNGAVIAELSDGEWTSLLITKPKSKK